MKICTKCREEKTDILFKKDKTRPGGLSSWCKSCNSDETVLRVNRAKANKNNQQYKKTDGGKIVNLRYKRMRRAAHRKARPLWACRTAIDGIYSEAAEKGLVVDHIVPLRSPFVCGLHTQENLRLCDKETNQVKGNRWWPGDWNGNFDIKDQNFHDLPHFELVT